MATFKVGDRVRFTGPDIYYNPPDRDRVYVVKGIPDMFDGIYLKDHSDMWYTASRFTLVEPPDPQAVPGVPEGYRLVRIGQPKYGEEYLGYENQVRKCDAGGMSKGWAVVEKTTKTERLWVWVDKHTGEATDVWLLDGETPVADFDVCKVLTNKLREVSA